MNVLKIPCNKSNYYSIKKRKLSDIKAIVIHYTANDGDTAENNGNYFKNNKVGASAHYFIDREGVIVKSVPYSFTAWSVESRGMTLKSWYRNSNTISIELCDFNKKKTISKKQKESLKWLIKYLKKKIPTIREVIRHYDVCGKACPVNLIESEKWIKFKKEIEK